MNYAEIKALALSYSNREDEETANRMDDFLKIVESRVNRKLRTIGMTYRIYIAPTGYEELSLPDDFGGIHEIKTESEGSNYKSLILTTPQSLDGLSSENLAKTYYAIIGSSSGKVLRVVPKLESPNLLSLTYYKKLTELTESITSNWLSSDYPDCYVFGLLVEISSFAKDADAKVLWDNRFTEAIAEIEFEDQKERWSGTPLETKIG